ncbi:hypothetical protein ONE63_011199 [Megalurothrips usitatus]|uniref:Uncharacterized protein n=1 Tax=Megalurothrips usitatus TaxID=439358 RepID=A0AAV7X6B0_9NEOP|nr:hypothetical protein ONE63_011199 [Megalurothrips usitatus]
MLASTRTGLLINKRHVLRWRECEAERGVACQGEASTDCVRDVASVFFTRAFKKMVSKAKLDAKSNTDEGLLRFFNAASVKLFLALSWLTPVGRHNP